MSLDRADAAQRAGVEPAYVDRLLELGMISTDGDGGFSTGDIRRVTLIQTLEASGLPLEGIASAIRDGQLSLAFMDTSNYDRFSTLTDTTFAELSARTGVPLELLMVIREAVGFAEPSPDAPMRDIELAIAPLVEAQVAEGFRPAVIERWLRVYGESMQRIAETEADWWNTEVEQRLMAAGMSPSEMMEHADVHIAQRMAPFLEDVILGIYHGRQEHNWTTSIINGVEAALAEAGVYARPEHPPGICFLDLTGYTRHTEEYGDDAAADLASRLGKVVRRSSAAHGGKPIKWLGDGVMFYFRDPGAGVESALEMVEEAGLVGLPPAHVGLHAGPVLFQQGDYFGQTVNVASRIADYARPGEILVSQAVVDSSEGTRASFSVIGPVELKGVSGPIHLHAARRPDTT
jgi:adenylate cyclase